MEPGSLTLSSQRLSSILAEMPEGDVTLQLGDNRVVVLEAGRIQTKLFSMAPDEFPPIRDFKDVEPLVLKQGILKRLFEKTSFAICTDQARYNLTGLLVEIADGRLTVVATDGRRMSMCVEGEDIPDGISFKVIIPGKMISELERLLGDEDEVKVFINESQAAFEFGSVRLVSALIEGNFPNYQMVVPKKQDKEAVAGLEAFIEAVRRTRTMTNDKFNSVRLNLSNATMTLKVVTPEVGEYVEDMAIEYEGPSLEIAFNPDFILEVLRHIDTEKVIISLKDAMSPGVLKPHSETQLDNYMNVIMPIRI